MKRIIFNFCFVWLAVSAFAGSKVVEMRNYGLVPDTHENLSPKLQKALQDIKSQVALGDKVTLLFESGRYDFHPEGAAVREYYISNHDQDNPKTVGFPLEDWKGLTDRAPILSFMGVCFHFLCFVQRIVLCVISA